MEIFNQLGIDWRLLIAQIINFLVLLFILNKFLYKPIIKVLAERTKKIDTSLKQAQEIEQSLAETKIKEEKIIAKAHAERKEILAEAQKLATKENLEYKQKTKDEIQRLIKEAKNHIASEKQRSRQDLKDETVELIVLAAKKVLGENYDEKLNKKLADEVLEQF